MIRLNLIGDSELTLKAAPLLGILGVESGEGITVNAVKGDRAGVCYKNGVATVYASQVMGHHTYPAYNEEAELTLPAENDNTGKYGPERSVDHIMLQNEEGVSVAVLGVVIDDCSMSGADHFPIFMDFSIQN